MKRNGKVVNHFLLREDKSDRKGTKFCIRYLKIDFDQTKNIFLGISFLSS